MKKIVLAIAVVGVIGALVWFRLSGGGAGQDMRHRGGPPDVTTIVVARRDVPLEITLPGRTAAYRVAEIRPRVNGIIEKRLFTEGSRVKAGEALYQLDDDVYKAALQSAEAGLSQAKATLHVSDLKVTRYKELLGTKAISQQDFDDAEAALEQAKASVAVANAAVRTAKLNLSYTRVFAPIDGRIGKSMMTEGALVTANQSQALAVVTQLDPVYVDIKQSSAENLKLRNRLGGTDKVKVRLVPDGATRPYPHEGTLQFSDVTVEASTGAVDLRAIVPNPDHELLPGMFVNATLDLGTDNTIAVPQQVVGREPDGSAYVWLVNDDDTVSKHSVTTLRAQGDEWVIASGLEPGQVLVLEGVQRLSPGSKVIPHRNHS